MKLLWVLLLALGARGEVCREAGTYLEPYPEDCSKYVSCEGNKGEVKECQAGYYFDTVTRSCVAPDDAYCYGQTTPAPTTPTPTTEIPPTGGPFDCQQGSSIYRPYPGDCSKYIECNFGNPITMNCPDGLFFDKNLLVCVFPKDAACDYSTKPRASEQCTDENSFYLIPFPGDCSKFIICDFGYPLQYFCPTGQNFDVIVNKCLDKTVAHCN